MDTTTGIQIFISILALIFYWSILPHKKRIVLVIWLSIIAGAYWLWQAASEILTFNP